MFTLLSYDMQNKYDLRRSLKWMGSFIFSKFVLKTNDNRVCFQKYH